MPGIHMRFESADLDDDAAYVAARVNEGIGGASLLRWLSAEARRGGLKTSEPRVEDHGWDLDVVDGGVVAGCASTIADGAALRRVAPVMEPSCHGTLCCRRRRPDRIRGRGGIARTDRVIDRPRLIVTERLGTGAVEMDWFE